MVQSDAFRRKKDPSIRSPNPKGWWMDGAEHREYTHPLDIIRLYLEEKVIVQLHDNIQLHGTLHAYDVYANMILGEVEEIVTKVGIDDETFEERVKTRRRTFPFLFVRGVQVILVSFPNP